MSAQKKSHIYAFFKRPTDGSNDWTCIACEAANLEKTKFKGIF